MSNSQFPNSTQGNAPLGVNYPQQNQLNHGNVSSSQIQPPLFGQAHQQSSPNVIIQPFVNPQTNPQANQIKINTVQQQQNPSQMDPQLLNQQLLTMVRLANYIKQQGSSNVSPEIIQQFQLLCMNPLLCQYINQINNNKPQPQAANKHASTRSTARAGTIFDEMIVSDDADVEAENYTSSSEAEFSESSEEEEGEHDGSDVPITESHIKIRENRKQTHVDENEIFFNEEEDIIEPQAPTFGADLLEHMYMSRFHDGEVQYLVRFQETPPGLCQWVPEYLLSMVPNAEFHLNRFLSDPISIDEIPDPDKNNIPVAHRREHPDARPELLFRLTYDQTDLFYWDIPDDETLASYYSTLIDYVEADPTPPEGELPDPRSNVIISKKGETMRSYQIEGLRWLVDCWRQGHGSVLADEMGLGKTIELLSFLSYLNHCTKWEGPYLIVIRYSTFKQWCDEIHKWTDLVCIPYMADPARRKLIRDHQFYALDELGNIIPGHLKFHILLVTYEILMKDYELINTINWNVVVLDEGHRIKNKNGKKNHMLAQLNCKHRIILTGTPIQSSLEELWSLLKFVSPNCFEDEPNEFSEDIDNLPEEKVLEIKQTISQHLLRRSILEVEQSIAPKEENVVFVTLTDVQKDLIRLTHLHKLWRLRGKKMTEEDDATNEGLAILKICSHPFLIPEAEEFYTKKLKLKRVDLLLAVSAKFQWLDNVLRVLKRGGHKVLIFSFRVDLLKLLNEFCTLRGYNTEMLIGSMDDNERNSSIERFSSIDSDSFIFLISTRAGSEGLNLTVADTAIIFDPDWNPQNDLQAQARCHRIGQTQKVDVLRLVSYQTYEHEMFIRAQRKLGLWLTILGSKEEDKNVVQHNHSNDEFMNYEELKPPEIEFISDNNINLKELLPKISTVVSDFSIDRLDFLEQPLKHEITYDNDILDDEEFINSFPLQEDLGIRRSTSRPKNYESENFSFDYDTMVKIYEKMKLYGYGEWNLIALDLSMQNEDEIIPISVDLTTAVDPFSNAISSALSYRFSNLFPVNYPLPTIIPKEDRIDQFYESNEIEPHEEILTPEYKEFLSKVDDFLIQFFKEYPFRLHVFLTAENENGAMYFLSSFIRPSVLPIIETSNVNLAASFVADICDYQILYDFFSPPRCITTPNFTISSQIGDCYDLSVLLTTTLTGIGYDAFVIVGYANRELTFSDLRYKKCPGIIRNEEKEDTNKIPKNKYLEKVINRVLDLRSKFDYKTEHPEPAPTPHQPDPIPPPDEYEGKRIFSWVMVKSARVELPNTVFIDCSTGDQYPLDSPLFGYIELAFNHQNVWINLQDIDAPKNDDTLNFEETNLWKPVISETLKMPSPVIKRLQVPEKLIFQKYPKGEKKLLWQDTLEERYAAYTRPDGLVKRFFIFQSSLSDIYEVREEFASLRQSLVERRIFIKEEEMYERFESGNKSSICTHKMKHNQYRLLEFDSSQRLDKLISRYELFGQKIVEKFGDRDDGLYERKICIITDSNPTSKEILYEGGPYIERITQKYRPSSQVPFSYTKTYALEQNFYKVYFDFVNHIMGVVYHHQPGRITNFSIEYRKENENDNYYIADPSKFYPNPPEIDQWYIDQTQNKLLEICKLSKKDSKKIAEEIVQWIQFRTEEESRPYLKMKSIDVALHRKLYSMKDQTGVMVDQPPPEPKSESDDLDEKNRYQLSINDPLSVYFPVEQVEMNEEIAKDIFNKAIEALKLRLHEEHELLQNRLNQEIAALKKKVLEFEMDQHQSMSKKQSDEHQEFCNKKTFLISVLQKRLKRFEATAARKLFDLMKNLKNHPKLMPFLGGTDLTMEQVDEKIKEMQNIDKKD
ncbi:SNF2 family N-terminal domain containing protein [Histomonas meleagridis]|uniref:SNF2 family N-terminal domain containing protein n=1 Tax=Histomonas meleagridis TaxID=135588 RepID=UPI00355A7625|nr:SNF2 family N-terminal domain containing protein [Histomonas meleagridis]KAH0801274.1 SNF2 family N-terminal domain containing protein [Histomonas meleagridis]